ncbi:MAG: A24 family peptidase [Inquilinaceae bacterium]
MDIFAVPHLPILALLIVLGWAAIHDARTFTIPNRIPLCVVGLYGAWLVAGTAGSLLPSVLVAASVLAGGFVLFVLRFLGGGDAKLMAALALWAGPALIVDFILWTVLAGGAIAGGMILAGLKRRVTTGSTAIDGVPLRAQRLPYGVAIAFGGCAVSLRLLTGAGV